MRKWYPAIPIAAALAFTAYAFQRLPLRVATHWDIHGQPNGYSGRAVAAILLPAIMVALWGALRGLPLIDPRRANYVKFQGTYDLAINAIVTLMLLVHVSILGRALGWPIPIDRVAPAIVGAMLLVLGNVLPRARPNWWFGIRTPWTLSNDNVWTRTHRVGGYLMTAAGAVVLLGVPLPHAWSLGVLVGAIAVSSLGSLVYSYFAWREEQQ